MFLLPALGQLFPIPLRICSQTIIPCLKTSIATLFHFIKIINTLSLESKDEEELKLLQLPELLQPTS